MTKPKIVAASSSYVTQFRQNTTIAPISLREHVGVVTGHWGLALSVAATVALGGAVYAYSKAPVYEGNLLISVTDTRAAEQRSVLGLPAVNADRKTAMSESEVIRSRVVLGAVVDKLHLDVSATPRYFPFLGRALATWNAGTLLTPEFLSKYAWGNEAISVRLFEVPASLIGNTFVVTKLSDSRYRLEEKTAGVNATGQVGTDLVLKTLGSNIRLRIDAVAGNDGVQYELTKNPRVVAMEGLHTGLSVSELGKDSGMLNISLSDKSPEKVMTVLNEIGATYMDFVRKQNEKKSSTSLQVLQAQLPTLKRRVELAEARVEDYRRAHSTVDLGEETRLKLGRYSATKTQLAELQQKRAEMSARLGDEHPLLVALDRQISAASREQSTVSSEIRSFPTVAKEVDRRSRTLQAETEIYNSVVRKVEELSVVAQDQSTNVSVIDDAVVPAVPKGSRLTIAAVFMIIGVLLGVFAAFLRKMFSNNT
jgi:tyrosine-protein kinase Etk/Wzc